MAERRMFAKTIVLSDAFLDMPMSARCLYFTLGMLADDDGFVNAPRSIMRQCGASDDDMKLLITKKFVLIFDSGVIVIKHWRINNYLRNDRYIETKYVDEKAELSVDEKGIYHRQAAGIPPGIPNNGIHSIGKDSIGEVSIVEDSLGKENNKTSFFLSDEKISEIMSFYLDAIDSEPCPSHIDFIKASIQSRGADRVLSALKKCVEDGKTSFPRVMRAINES
jgi:hypothetical protein